MASLKELAAAQKKRARVMREYKQGPPQQPSNRNDEKFQELVRKGRVIQADLDKMSFKKAFASKRKAGNKTFTWRGKRYTTELAKPKAATTTTKPKTNGKARTYNKGDGTTTTMQKTAKLKTLGYRDQDGATGSRSKTLRSGAAGQKTTDMRSPQSRMIEQIERINRGKKVKINRNPKDDYGAMKRGGKVKLSGGGDVTTKPKPEPKVKAKPMSRTKDKLKATPPVTRLDKARNKNPELQRLLKESDETTARKGSRGLLSGPGSTVGMLKIAKKRKRIKELQTPKDDYGAMKRGGKVKLSGGGRPIDGIAIRGRTRA